MSGIDKDPFNDRVITDPPVSCERLTINTPIASPKEQVIAQLTPGDVLSVELEQQAGTSVIALTFNGLKAGGIASAQTTQLRQCIENGTRYEATVLTKNDAHVQVRIKAI